MLIGEIHVGHYSDGPLGSFFIALIRDDVQNQFSRLHCMWLTDAVEDFPLGQERVILGEHTVDGLFHASHKSSTFPESSTEWPFSANIEAESWGSRPEVLALLTERSPTQGTLSSRSSLRGRLLSFCCWGDIFGWCSSVGFWSLLVCAQQSGGSPIAVTGLCVWVFFFYKNLDDRPNIFKIEKPFQLPQLLHWDDLDDWEPLKTYLY